MGVPAGITSWKMQNLGRGNQISGFRAEEEGRGWVIKGLQGTAGHETNTLHLGTSAEVVSLLRKFVKMYRIVRLKRMNLTQGDPPQEVHGVGEGMRQDHQVPWVISVGP